MKPAVSARDLVVRYGETVALGHSTFEIPSGQVTAVIGPNGSGKSTLLTVIAGLHDPASGDLDVPARLNGSHRISYVLQTTKVNDTLPISVREVVTMGRYSGLGAYRWLTARDRQEIDSAMTRTGISDLSGRQLSELSGGQRQRVFVAQGMAQEHDLLLLDEPMTGIDLTTAQAIDQAIHDEIERGCTVIITTHDLSEAQVADYVLLLSGHVVAAGKPEDVLTPANLKEAYGPALLHIEEGRLFIDDAAHIPVEGRHIHRERTIHTEPSHPETPES